ncbi:unnamed protein product [Vicia faba]|uniref:Uncharacterized GPI-anchored protein At5g19230-like domain-containing protein n=1 Tax=Vicia faba TaxID=3906 RepID=A0AAV1B226_VICFA|nr:unnamed protein product [Vicia faba]
MACFKLNLLLLASLCAFLLLSNPAHCSDKVDSVLKGINSYRETKNVAPLNKNDKASCLADEVAEEIQDTPCEKMESFYLFFLNNSKYTGVGLNSEDDWMVLVLTTTTPTGTFSAATSLHANLVSMAFLFVVILIINSKP